MPPPFVTGSAILDPLCPCFVTGRLLFVSKSSLFPGMRTETEAASAAHSITAVHRGPGETLPLLLRQRRILWICVLGWTVFVGFALWWLVQGNGGASLWVFQEGDLQLPGFSQKVQAMFRGELGLQRTFPWILF